MNVHKYGSTWENLGGSLGVGVREDSKSKGEEIDMGVLVARSMKEQPIKK